MFVKLLRSLEHCAWQQKRYGFTYAFFFLSFPFFFDSEPTFYTYISLESVWTKYTFVPPADFFYDHVISPFANETTFSSPWGFEATAQADFKKTPMQFITTVVIQRDLKLVKFHILSICLTQRAECSRHMEQSSIYIMGVQLYAVGACGGQWMNQTREDHK